MASTPVPYFRKSFSLDRPFQSARLAITALGLYEAEINAVRVGDEVFAPGWTDYHKRVAVREYDVTSHLREGENVLGVILGDGWYCGEVARKGRRLYGERPALLAALEVTFSDGSVELIVTDPSWKFSTGPIMESDLLAGEDYDARLEMPGWSAPGFSEENWQPVVEVFPEPRPELSPDPGVPVRRIEEMIPEILSERSQGQNRLRIFDLRQNFTGRMRIRARGPRGAVVRFRFAEMLNPDGTLYTENLLGARCTDYYTCKGEGEETWEPRFTFHGFRYLEAEISRLGADDFLQVTGIVLHADLTPLGRFRCSHDLLNQLQHNIVWGQKSNFLEVPMDCPQRDERLGWTGDAQVFIRTACFNMDMRAFFHKWMRDARDAQGVDGSVPEVIPNVEFRHAPPDGGPAWSDAHIICPWTIYLCYGDRQILEDHYESRQRYLHFQEHKASKNLIRAHPDFSGHRGYGDWLALDGGGNTEGLTPKDLIGTAFLAYDASLMTKIARVLDRETDARRYEDLQARVSDAFQRRERTQDELVVKLTVPPGSKGRFQPPQGIDFNGEDLPPGHHVLRFQK